MLVWFDQAERMFIKRLNPKCALVSIFTCLQQHPDVGVTEGVKFTDINTTPSPSVSWLTTVFSAVRGLLAVSDLILRQDIAALIDVYLDQSRRCWLQVRRVEMMRMPSHCSQSLLTFIIQRPSKTPASTPLAAGKYKQPWPLICGIIRCTIAKMNI